MNITEEAKRRYPALQSDNPRAASREFGRDGFIAGAEWARKEALREAAELVADAAHVRDLGTATSVLRALAEGVSDGQQ